MSLVLADDGTTMDVPAKTLVALILDAFRQGGLQLTRPLSISFGGRTISYGSGAEAFQAVRTMIGGVKDLMELEPIIDPYVVNQPMR